MFALVKNGTRNPITRVFYDLFTPSVDRERLASFLLVRARSQNHHRRWQGVPFASCELGGGGDLYPVGVPGWLNGLMNSRNAVDQATG
jgi:hypothetical protein